MTHSPFQKLFITQPGRERSRPEGDRGGDVKFLKAPAP
jgi:hypothetical protein